MSDLPAVQPPPQLPAIPKPKRRFSEKKFVNAYVVRTADGKALPVPIDSVANKARTQIIAARATELFTNQIEKYANMGLPLPPKQVKEFMDAAKTLAELNEAAHGTGAMPGVPQNQLTGLGQMVAGAVMAGAALAKGEQVNLEDQMRKLNELGKRKEVVVMEMEK